MTEFQEELLRLLRTQIEKMEKIVTGQDRRIEMIETVMRTMEKNNDMQCLSLLSAQNESVVKLLQEQSTRMMEIATATRTLERNSMLDHDDQPFPKHKLGKHEPGWRAVYETLTVKMKDQVERWRNGMDSTLIFVALFVTVITAFQAPVSQNLSQNPADLTNDILTNLTVVIYEVAAMNGLKVPTNFLHQKAFHPTKSDEVVTLFWYSSLLLSLTAAIFSVLGRHWVKHLTKKPEGQTYRDKSWRLNFREKYAERLLRPILDSLHPILILSIILFIVGLLYQLWSITIALHRAPVLIVTSSLGSALIFGMTAVTVFTLIHGVHWEESPFTTSASLGIRRCLSKKFVKAANSKSKDFFPLFCTTVKHMTEAHHFDHVSSVPVVDLLCSPEIDELELAVETIVAVLGSDASLRAKQTVAWNLCGSSWTVCKNGEEARDRVVECYQRLRDAFISTNLDTPLNQERVKLCFAIARIVALLKFSGFEVHLDNLGKKELTKLYINIFMMDPKFCISEEDLASAKHRAWGRCEELAWENRQYFDNIAEKYPDLLSAIARKDVHERWKQFVLPYLEQKDVINFLDLISSESNKVNADHLHTIELLSLVLLNCGLPIILPGSFDLSSIIQFATSSRHRFDKDLYGIRPSCPVDVVLSYLTIMDDSLLTAQRNSLGFLESLDEIDTKRPKIRDGIASANVKELLQRKN